MECLVCGKITKSEIGLFCSSECLTKYDRRKQVELLALSQKITKHEEVKRMAEKVYIRFCIEFECCEGASLFFDRHNEEDLVKCAWDYAEAFCNFAKEKEKQDG